MRIVIPGGSGQVGTLLARAFHGEGHEVVVLGRSPKPAPWRVERWDPLKLDGWERHFDGAEVVINLAGRSVNCRYTTANRKAIIASRVDSVRAVGEAIARAAAPPTVWLQASTATIYAHRYDAANDDLTGIIGGDETNAPDTWRFSIEVARAWERALDDAVTPRTRKVAMRAAMVMSPDRDGIFDTLLGLVRRRLGGTCGDGRQYISWIHEADFIAAVRLLIANPDLVGPVAIAAPEPLSNREFMATLRRAWGTRIGLPSARWMLEIGALLMGSETELILKSRRVVPGRLLQAGMTFAQPRWAGAADDLCRRWRASR